MASRQRRPPKGSIGHSLTASIPATKNRDGQVSFCYLQVVDGGRENGLNAPSDKPEDHCDFARAAEEYADKGIPAIPLGGGDGKMPLVGNYAKYSIRRAFRDAIKHPRANVGFMCGPDNAITVVDIDEPDVHALHWALHTFGESPVVVLTGSGKYHIYYRHSGEGRHIFPRDRPGFAIDILGRGLCVAPPSVRPGGQQYEFAWGDLDELKYLPPIHSGAVDEFLANQRTPHTVTGFTDVRETGEVVQQGNRTNVMFAHARKAADTAPNLEAVCGELLALNGKFFNPPMTDAEVRKQARGAWKLKLENQLWLPGKQHLKLAASEIEPLLRRGGERALTLFLKLKLAHGHWRKHFAISPEGMAEGGVVPGWGKQAYRGARNLLESVGLIAANHRGGAGPGDPSIFEFSIPTRH